MIKAFSPHVLEQAIANNLLVVSVEDSWRDVVRLITQGHNQDQDSVRSGQSNERAELPRSCVSCVLVVAKSKLVGILTQSDLLSRLMVMESDIDKIKVADVMTQPVITMRRSEFQDVITPLNLLRQHHISHLPLLDEHDYPIGIITLKELLKIADFIPQQDRTSQTEYESLLTAIANRIQSSLDLQTILDSSVTEIRQFLQTDRVIAYRFEPDWSGLVVAESVLPRWSSLLGRTISDPHFQENMVEPYKNGRIQVTDNIYLGNLTWCHLNLLNEIQVKAIIVVPILNGDQLWGLLAAQECAQPRHWERSTVELLQQLATHIGLAIRQSSMMSDLQQLNQSLEKKIEERTIELAHNENCLNLIISSVSEGILIANQEGQIVFANPSAAKTFGMSVDQLVGLIIGVPNILNNQFEITHLSHDGKIGESEMHVVIIEWDKQPAYLISLHDITERLQVEAKLLKIQTNLAEAQQIAHVGSYEMDVVTRTVSCSEEMSRLLGLDLDQSELAYEQFVQYICPQDLDMLNHAIDRAIQVGEPYELDLQITRDDGSTGYLFAKGTPKRNDVGEIRYLFGTAIDISDRKANESMLRRYERVVAATTDALVLYDRNYIYQLANQVYLNWHNKQQEQIIGHSIEGILGGSSFKDHLQLRLEHCLAGEVQRYEDWFDYQDGRRRFVSVIYSPYIEIDGRITGVLASMHDLTELKQIEEALRKSELQLRLTNEELSRATRLKDEFLANMSHELRTPLNSILGMTEALQEQIFGSINEKQRNALQTVERSSEHLLMLINDILDVAKIESGQIELDFTPTNVAMLCQSSLAFIKQQALKKRIQLEIKIPPNLPEQMLDERRIRQVLINLLNNAMKFTSEGGRITLEVTKHKDLESDNSDDWMRFAVTDTGIGIAPENIKKLFQPFVQIDSALNRQYAGTGLGLALAKQMVELHGGRVSLTSELGVGSCFMIDLPYTSSSSGTSMHEQLATTSELEVPWSNRTKQIPLILIAEDNEANIVTVSGYLEARGYRLILAKNGQEAIALAKSHQPDIILMDIQMPVMDGLEATKQIRLDPDLMNVPIIAMTALAMTGDREKCLKAGVNEYLTKPVKLKQLANTIQQLLNP